MGKNIFLSIIEEKGKEDAKLLQEQASSMTDTEIIANSYRIPKFKHDVQYLNYKAGFVCQTDQGNVVKLLQPYDSTIYTQEPEELPAQWGFYWSTDPETAKPFISISTSPYYKNSCCTIENEGARMKTVYRSKIDNNVWSPLTNPEYWEEVELT